MLYDYEYAMRFLILNFRAIISNCLPQISFKYLSCQYIQYEFIIFFACPLGFPVLVTLTSCLTPLHGVEIWVILYVFFFLTKFIFLPSCFSPFIVSITGYLMLNNLKGIEVYHGLSFWRLENPEAWFDGWLVFGEGVHGGSTYGGKWKDSWMCLNGTEYKGCLPFITIHSHSSCFTLREWELFHFLEN